MTAIRRLTATAVLFLAGSAQAADVGDRLDRVEEQLTVLERGLYQDGSGAGALPADAASMEVRLTQVEERMRSLTGRLEVIEYAQERLRERMEVIGRVDEVSPLTAEETDNPGQRGSRQDQSGVPGRAASMVAASTGGTTDGTPASMRGGHSAVLGTLSPEELEKADRSAPSTPENLPPREVYNSALDLMKQKRYDEAVPLFQQFAQENPDDELAGNAYYWIGEASYVQKKYDQAAVQFLESYRKFPKGNKAPDSLLKLSKSLAESGKTKEACTTLKKLSKEFPDGNDAVAQQRQKEQARLKCQ